MATKSASKKSTKTVRWLGLSAAIAVIAIVAVIVIHHEHGPRGEVKGSLLLYPIGPTCASIADCSRPADGQVVELVATDGHIVATATTAASGRYRLAAPPGSYMLRLGTKRYGRDLAVGSQAVSLRAGDALEHDLIIDTGIR